MSQFKHASIEEIKQKIDQGQITIIDSRAPQDFEIEHIKGAINLDRSSAGDFAKTLNKNQTIVVYCYRGISCQSIAQDLVDSGFTDVYSMDGGFTAWHQKYPMTNKAQ